MARLMNHTAPVVQAFLGLAERCNSGIWLKSIKASLREPGGPLLRSLSGHLNFISAIEFTPDSRHCVSADHKGTIKLWDVEVGNELAKLSGDASGARAIAITPDGLRPVTVSWDSKLRVWDLQARRLLREMNSAPYPDSIAVTADGEYAVSNADRHRTLKVWDLMRGKALPRLRGHADEVNAIRAIPNSSLFISASNDKTCKVWNLKARRQVATLPGHSGEVTAVSTTPDGRYAVSQSVRELKVWELEGFRELLTVSLESSSEKLIAAVRTRDREYLIYTFKSDVINVLNLETGAKVGAISSAGRLFTKGHD